MINSELISEAISILKKAILENKSIRNACIENRRRKTFVRDIVKGTNGNNKELTLLWNKYQDKRQNELESKASDNKNARISRTINIIKKAILENKSIRSICIENKMGRTFVSDIIKEADGSNKELTLLWNKYIDSKKSNQAKKTYTNPAEKSDIEYDAYEDENYDSRSLGESIRDDNEIIILRDGNKINKISNYHYKILVKNQPPLEGFFSREEMNLVYRLYSRLEGAGLTQRTVSRYFKDLTFRDFKRILRAFNITKSSIPIAPHILEEENTEKIVEIIFKNKENDVLKKIEEERGKINEKKIIDLHKEIIEIKDDNAWIEQVINRYYNNKENNCLQNNFLNCKNSKNIDKNYNPLFIIFGDIHYGKKFDNPVFGRGYNKTIAHERIMEIAQNTSRKINECNIEEVVFIFLGDLVENVLEDGMHPGHTREMDLFQDEQIFYAVDSIKDMFKYIINSTNNVNIELYAISGNHDRIGMDRKEDKNRTAGKIALSILQRDLKNFNINVFIPQNNIIRIVKNKLLIFSQHGDASLSKRKPEELINMYGEPGCFSLLLQGHWHSLKVEEKTNFVNMKIPSIASPDKFIVEELGYSSLPGYIEGRQPKSGVGFDFGKITLY